MKKRLLFIGVFVFLYAISFSQGWRDFINQYLPKDKLEYQLTFFDYQEAYKKYEQAFNAKGGFYMKDGKKTELPGHKQFRRWEWYWKSRVNMFTGEFSTKSAWDMIQEHKEQNPYLYSKAMGEWNCIGPMDASFTNASGQGRVVCIGFHPTNPNIYYVGSVSGGLWKTIDNGNTYFPLTDNLGKNAILQIHIPDDFATSNSMYIVAGNWTQSFNQGNYGNYGNFRRIYKSLDGGETFELVDTDQIIQNVESIGVLNAKFNNDNFDNIIVYLQITPGYPNNTYYKTYETFNGGTTWNEINEFPDWTSHPTNPNIKYKTEYSKFYKSTDGGNTWVEKLSLTSFSASIAVTEDEPNYVYLLPSGLGTNNETIFYKSIDGGETFVNTTPNGPYLLYTCNGVYGTFGGVGPSGHRMLIVNPLDANDIYVGGRLIHWHSSDGGYTWYTRPCGNQDPDKSTHADKHFLGFQPVTNLLFEGNDGGIATTSDGIYWNKKSVGLLINQIYAIGTSPTDPNEMIFGMQDNGTMRYNSSTSYQWTHTNPGADGMDCAIFPLNSNIQYSSAQYGFFFRTTDKWSSSVNIKNNYPSGFYGYWFTQLYLDPQNANTFYILGNKLIKTTNGGNSFTVISEYSNPYSQLAVSNSNPNILYFANEDNNGYNYFYKSENGGQTWTDIYNNFTFASFVDIRRILVKETDPNTVWLVAGWHVNGAPSTEFEYGILKTIDGGQNWNNISEGLPEYSNTDAIQSIVFNKQQTNGDEVYVGTNGGGVYVKRGDSEWVPFMTGLPGAAVIDLEITNDENNPENSRIRAGTHGRSIWESPLLDNELPVIVQQPIDADICSGDSISIFVSTEGALYFQWYKNGNSIYGATDSILTFNPAIINNSGNYYCSVTNLSGAVNSNTVSVTIHSNPTPNITGDLSICEGDTSILDAGADFSSYLWSTGETTQIISVTLEDSYSVEVTSGFGCTGNDQVSLEVTEIPLTPSISANGPTVFCDVESITISVDSPQNGITYHWTNGETGNSITVNETGDYSCYGSNGECESENSNIIPVIAYITPEIPDISADDPTLCEGESCTVTINNVQTGVTYYWSNGEIGTSIIVDEEGSYYCYGDGGECQSDNSESIDVIVTEIPDTPTIIAEGSTEFCVGESVELMVELPQPGIVYYWTTGQTGTSITVNLAGDYNCYAQNGECVSDSSNVISIITYSVPETPSITASSTTLCEGEVSTLTVLSPEYGVTYMWSNGETGNSIEITSADTYSCYGDNGNCQGESSNFIIVQVQTVPVPNFTSDVQGGAAPLTVQFEDMSTGYPVLWYWQFGDGSTSTMQNPSHTYENTGVYSVSLEVTTSFGCNDEFTIEDYIDVITGITAPILNFAISLYPNPSKGEILVKVNGYNGTIKSKIMNLYGVEVSKASWEENSNGSYHHFDLSKYKPGTYYMILQMDEQKVVKRFVLL